MLCLNKHSTFAISEAFLLPNFFFWKTLLSLDMVTTINYTVLKFYKLHLYFGDRLLKQSQFLDF